MYANQFMENENKKRARRKWSNKNPDYAKEYYLKQQEIFKEKARNYYLANKDKIKEYKRLHHKKKKQNDPAYKLRCAISKYINRALKKKQTSKNASFLLFVDWTPEKLKLHLEEQFEPWMTWENHGLARQGERSWHIDHIVPQSLLPYDSMTHPNFKVCWALTNLRPLEAISNCKKGNKLTNDI